MLIAFLNAAPVAVSSTLFLFYVEHVLESAAAAGPLLLVFFLSAALAAPIWTWIATRVGSRPALLAAMVVSIAAFAVVLALGPGDLWIFAAVCLVSGFALGADFALLPAAFAARMADVAPEASAGFGLWAFVSKATLAVATVAVLPVLEAAGLQNAAGPTPASLSLLSSLYAGVPCALKLGAMAVLAVTRLPRPKNERED